MKMVLLWILGIFAVVVVAFALYVRLAPNPTEAWHIDPLTAEDPGGRGFLVRAEGGDGGWGTFDTDPRTLLGIFDEIARATPRTQRVAGSAEEGRITYLTRSRLWGFADFTTVQAVAADGGARIVVMGRARFGQSDLGVNRARIETWGETLRQRLATGQ